MVITIYAPLSISIILMVWCLHDAVATDESRMRNLSKGQWILLILVPLVGSVAWLVAGRPVVSGPRPARAPVVSGPRRGQAPATDDDRLGRAVSPDPGQAEDFLKRVRERAEDQRRRYAQQQRKQRELE